MTQQTNMLKETSNENLLFGPIRQKRKKFPFIIITICVLLIIGGILIAVLKPFDTLFETQNIKDSKEQEHTLFRQGLLAVEFNEKYGYIDKNGKYVIEPQFTRAGNFDNMGLAWVTIGELGKEKYGYIDTNGKWKINPQYDDASSFEKDGLACVKYNGLYGYINNQGNWIINPQFEDAYTFSDNGLACVQLNGKYGFINSKGKYEIYPTFDLAHSFSNGAAAVHYNDKWGYIDTTGNLIIEAKVNYLYALGDFNKNGLAHICNSDGKCGIIDINGDYVIKPIFDAIGDFSENGLAPILLNDKCGFIDKNGDIVLEVQFDELGGFAKNGLAAVLSYNDKTVESNRYETGKVGFIDKSGQLIIEQKFDIDYYCGVDPTFFDDGYAVVCLGKYFGIIDYKGEYIVNPQFSYVNIY